MVSKILIVDDEPTIRRCLTRILEDSGYSVRVADSAQAALDEARNEQPDMILLDICLPDTSGLEVLAQLKQINERIVIITMTAYESTKDAVLAMKRGAYDYLSKPFNIDAIGTLVKKALANGNGQRIAHIPPHHRIARERMIGTSPAICKIMDTIQHLPENALSSVLIDGETGTGKEVLAHAIHEITGRTNKPFVAISCGAIPRELMESELFGYDGGAFTGAQREGKMGAFERAGVGTILLDEIGELELNMQVKLLRVLEAREFSRVGGVKEIPLKAHIIAATNRDLKQSVDQRQFRADLYFRLNVMRITLPPLRERGGDIVLLAEFFLREFNERFDKNFTSISPLAQTFMKNYAWPGNVRELRNVIEHIVLMESGDEIFPFHLPEEILELNSAKSPPLSLGHSLSDMRLNDGEKKNILHALERTNGNVVKAASLLGLRRGAMRYRMEKYGIIKNGKPILRREHDPQFSEHEDRYNCRR